jgi:hypothetical protein
MSNDTIDIEILEEIIEADICDNIIQIDIEGAGSGGHIQNTDTILDEGGVNEVSAFELKNHINNTTIHHEMIYDEAYQAYIINN